MPQLPESLEIEDVFKEKQFSLKFIELAFQAFKIADHLEGLQEALECLWLDDKGETVYDHDAFHMRKEVEEQEYHTQEEEEEEEFKIFMEDEEDSENEVHSMFSGFAIFFSSLCLVIHPNHRWYWTTMVFRWHWSTSYWRGEEGEGRAASIIMWAYFHLFWSPLISHIPSDLQKYTRAVESVSANLMLKHQRKRYQPSYSQKVSTQGLLCQTINKFTPLICLQSLKI